MRTLFILLLLAFGNLAEAKLLAKIHSPKRTGNKVVVRIELKNTFSEKIESARAVMFLLDENSKVVGQSVQWIIGGDGKHLSLSPNAKSSYNFVIPIEKSFSDVRLTCSRLILNGGKPIEPAEGFEIGD